MKILSANQVKEADQYTIKQEPIPSINLMERAAERIAEALKEDYPGAVFHIFCGMGNNGGDGLAVARILLKHNIPLTIYVLNHTENGSADFNTNLQRLKNMPVTVNTISSEEDFFDISEGVIVDALLGSGLNRPLKGLLKETTDWLNKQDVTRVSIDIPTGLFADRNEENDLDHVINAHETLSLQMPKLSFFHRDTASLAGRLRILDIGLHPDFIKEAKTDNYYFDSQEARLLFRPRKQYSFKGTYGHALLLAGSKGKTGAAILAAKAVMRSGAGLLTVHTCGSGVIPLQSALPEAMLSIDQNEDEICNLPEAGNFKAVGMGPGIGTAPDTGKVLKNLIQNSRGPLVLDADALNILAENRTWLAFLPQGTILTPHIGEFRRLLGKEKLGEKYVDELRSMAAKNRITIVLKDSNTAVASPDGALHFINSGSPALATAGSGDVLTGVILGLLSQGYPPFQAALLGVWIHGRAGTLAGFHLSLESVVVSDVIENLPLVFKELAPQAH